MQTEEEYQQTTAIVADLRQKCDAVTKEITPMQRREADLRKLEYEKWQRVRAIKRYLCEKGEKEKMDFLKWEVKQRQRRDDEERAGTRRPQ
jgi:hypothetical protein